MADTPITVPLSRLSEAMEIVSDRLDRRLNASMHAGADRMVKTILGGTPVDTGQARSNWITTLGTPSTGQIETYKLATTPSKQERQVFNIAYNQFLAASAGWNPVSEQPLFLTNNWELIEDLNAGNISRQGSRFVEAGVKSFRLGFRARFKKP